MKKIYFGNGSGRLPKINSKRFPASSSFRTSSYRTDAELLAEKEELLRQIQQKVDTASGTRAAKQEFEDFKKTFEGISLEGIRSLMKEDTGVMATVTNLSQKVQKLETEGQKVKEDLSIRGQIAKWMETNKAILDGARSVADDIVSIDTTKLRGLPQLKLRAAITMTDAASLGSSAYLPRIQVAPGIIDLVRTQPTFWDYLPKGRTRANPYVWVNKTNKQGAAAFIGEGVLKPLASFELSTESSVPKKVAERMKMSNELLYDVDGFASLVESELAYEVKMAANAKVLVAAGSATDPKGITNYGTTYTSTAIKTPSPNNYDCIRAAKAILTTLNYTNNIVAFINPIDAANMDLAKASTSGVYMLPPFTTSDGRKIGGVTVVEDNNIAVGYLLIGDLSKYKLLMYQDFFINWGWENDDFSKNLTTVIGEMRFHQYYSANHVGAIIYDTFANIKTALT